MLANANIPSAFTLNGVSVSTQQTQKQKKNENRTFATEKKFPLTITLNDGLVWCVRAHTRATEHDRMSKLTNEQMNGDTSKRAR